MKFSISELSSLSRLKIMMERICKSHVRATSPHASPIVLKRSSNQERIIEKLLHILSDFDFY